MEIEKTAETMGKRLELVGKNWKIMNALSKREYYCTELARELRKTSPEISVRLKHLRAEGLVELRQEERERKKHFCLSNLGQRIANAVTEAMRLAPEGKLEEWQIEELLAILHDGRIDKEIRTSYSRVFNDLSHQSPLQLINNLGVREFIEEIVANASVDEVGENLNRSVPLLVSSALRNQTWRDWVVKKLYPVLVSNVESENEKVRARALRQVVQVATLGSDPKLASEVRKKLLKLWFSDETDASGDFGNEIREQLVLLCLHGGFTNAKAIFDETRNKAGDKNPHIRGKAERLLESLRGCILSQKQSCTETLSYTTQQTSDTERVGT